MIPRVGQFTHVGVNAPSVHAIPNGSRAGREAPPSPEQFSTKRGNKSSPASVSVVKPHRVANRTFRLAIKDRQDFSESNCAQRGERN